jgi:hypothetical protein
LPFFRFSPAAGAGKSAKTPGPAALFSIVRIKPDDERPFLLVALEENGFPLVNLQVVFAYLSVSVTAALVYVSAKQNHSFPVLPMK